MKMIRMVPQITYTLLFSILSFFLASCGGEAPNQQPEALTQNGYDSGVLVFSKTEGFRHNSIEAGGEAIMRLGEEHGFGVTWTENSSYFTGDSLSSYDAVIFLNTTLDVLDEQQQSEFEQYIRSGGGFVGIHSASDTEYDWQWYGNLVGAYFDNHPGNPNVREAVVTKVMQEHPSVQHLDDRWRRADEWYNFGFISESINVILELDTDSYEGSDHPGDHPVSWFQEYDGGRSFYTAMGHTSESYSEPEFLEHLLHGIRFAMGE